MFCVWGVQKCSYFQGSENTVYDTMITDTRRCTFIQPHGMHSPKVNCSLWVMVTWQCRCVTVTGAPLWWETLIMRWGYTRVRDGL